MRSDRIASIRLAAGRLSWSVRRAARSMRFVVPARSGAGTNPSSERSRGPRHRKVILAMVFGVFLVVLAVMATAQAVLVTTHFSVAALDAALSRDRAFVRLFVASNILSTDLEGQPSASRIRQLEEALATVVEPGEIERLELRDGAGTIIAADDPGLNGQRVPPSSDYAAAATGQTSIRLIEDGTSQQAGGAIGHGPLLQEYLPIITRQEVVGIVGLWRDAEPILTRMEAARRDVVLVTLAAAGVAAVILLVVFGRAQRQLSRQTTELLETERRDSLTGTLNHGSLVHLLAEAVEKLRTSDRRLTVGLLDIDNFRLLNDTHGHAAGDRVLLEVCRLLENVTPPTAVVGRYGPDEFLVIGSPADADAVAGWMELFRNELADLSLQFGDSEPLPITVSIGLCTYPDDAAAVTELLSRATTVLGEAKASGGDTLRTASREAPTPIPNTYNVLQGLVIAIDTKDHYTKRHSEDVARYAVFLARQLELGEEMNGILLTAGLLHDVGKIGIPDALLRKPGRLSPDEYLIFRQHVALGDLIVRDLPQIEQVREGVRHHHERWDGAGYLDGLSGGEIPLVARILAVADTFSAMTTSRPYRRALDVREALKRLSDAAGTQLEESLVRTFIEGIETKADAPMPGDDRNRGRLWAPVEFPLHHEPPGLDTREPFHRMPDSIAKTPA